MKQSKWYGIVALLLLPLALGCSGGTLNKTIAPSPTPNVRFIPAENTVYLSDIKTVAVFPFADYSHQQGHMGVDDWGGNIKIQEEITDHLIAHGLSVSVQEDVNTLLVDQDVIRPIDKDKYLINGTFESQENAVNRVGSPEHDLVNYEHSDDMKHELLQIIKRQKHNKKPRNTKSPILQGNTVGLSKDKIVEIAQILDVDLIIRGRIIDYGYKDIGTMNPLYRGVVPVVIDSMKDILFGATGSYGYEDDLDDIESMLMGAAMGYVVGNNLINSSTSSRSGIFNGVVSRRVRSSSTSHDDSAPEGAMIGAGAGWLASQHPKKAKRAAVVQVRIYAQDGETGDVLWSNRVEMEYTPKSNFAYAETHPKVMFDKVVKEGIKALMDSFFIEAENIFSESEEQAAPIQKEGV